MAAKTIQLGSFCGGTSKLLDSEFLGHETSLNCFPETVEASETYTNKMLRCLEGFTKFSDSSSYTVQTDGLSRKFFVASKSLSTSANAGDPVLYAIFGATLVRVYKDGTTAAVATLANSDNASTRPIDISFAETSGDPAYLVICGKFSTVGFNKEENLIFCVSLDASDVIAGQQPPKVNPITLPDAYDHTGKIKPTKVAYLNYRLVVNDEGHDYIYWSELNKPNGVDDEHAFEQLLTRYAYTKTDGTQVTFADNQYYPPSYGSYTEGTLQTENVWMAALNNVKVDFRADNIKNIIALDQSILVFGSRSYQVYQWQNSQYAPFVTTSKTSTVGLRSPEAIATFNNSVFFLGYGETGSNAVWRAGESGLERVSNTAIEQRITAVVEQDKSFAFTYTYKGHSFFVLTFYGTDDNFTICYDIKENVWHSRGSLDNLGNVNFWNARFALPIYGKVIFSEFNTYDLFEMDENSFVDASSRAIPRERTTGIKFDGQGEILIQSLELVINNGSAVQIQDDDDYVNPDVMLQVSFDGGFTWSSEKWAKAGKVGLYNFRTIWRNLGKGSKVSFRVKFTAAAPFNIATAYLTYTPLKNRVG